MLDQGLRLAPKHRFYIYVSGSINALDRCVCVLDLTSRLVPWLAALSLPTTRSVLHVFNFEESVSLRLALRSRYPRTSRLASCLVASSSTTAATPSSPSSSRSLVSGAIVNCGSLRCGTVRSFSSARSSYAVHSIAVDSLPNHGVRRASHTHSGRLASSFPALSSSTARARNPLHLYSDGSINNARLSRQLRLVLLVRYARAIGDSSRSSRLAP